MKKSPSIFVFLLISSIFNTAFAVGSYPVPKITDVSVQASTQYDTEKQRYTYSYVIHSGENNIGKILMFFLDITRPGLRPGNIPEDFSFTDPLQKTSTAKVISSFNRRANLPYETTIEVVQTDLPKYWSSDVTQYGQLFMAVPSGGIPLADGSETKVDFLEPGETVGPLYITALTPPTLRSLSVEPDWIFVAKDEDDLEENREAALEFEEDLSLTVTTIGPQYANPVGHELLDRVIKDIAGMEELGWIIDSGPITQVKDLLSQAKQALLNSQGSEAKRHYQEILDLMAQVDESQMRREAIDLIRLNIQLKLENEPDTVVPRELALLVNPAYLHLNLGDEAKFDIRIIDKARDNEEFPNYSTFDLEVLSGPNTGIKSFSPSFEYQQHNTIGYRGLKTGSDLVRMTRFSADDGVPELVAYAEVDWDGGPDYVISFFSPPFLEYRGSPTIWIHEATKNIGNLDSLSPSKIQYYLSTDSVINTDTAFILHERSIAPLNQNEENVSGPIEINWPSQYPPGNYYFAACVDAENQVTELNENNNCSFHSVRQVAYVAAAIGESAITVNAPPNCDQAIATPGKLWPPNHKFVDVEIEGVTDADQDQISINIDRITQDEPVNGTSSGNTAPDAMGIGSSAVRLRAERDGSGDGRVYQISFTATDTAGNSCSGTVMSSAVMHDQSGKSQSAVDSGQFYDSTVE